MSNDLIRVDYDALAEIAARFAQQAQQAQQVFQAISSSKGQLEQGGWEGRGADSFYAEMESDVLPAVNRLHQALNEASAITSKISQIWQQADEEASGPFKGGGAAGGPDPADLECRG